jgi:hypothetical protein
MPSMRQELVARRQLRPAFIAGPRWPDLPGRIRLTGNLGGSGIGRPTKEEGA